MEGIAVLVVPNFLLSGKQSSRCPRWLTIGWISGSSSILRNFHITFLRIDLRLALVVMCFPYRNKKHSPTSYSPNDKTLRSNTTHNLFLWEGERSGGLPPIISHPAHTTDLKKSTYLFLLADIVTKNKKDFIVWECQFHGGRNCRGSELKKAVSIKSPDFKRMLSRLSI